MTRNPGKILRMPEQLVPGPYLSPSMHHAGKRAWVYEAIRYLGQTKVTRKIVPVTGRASKLIPCIFGIFKNKIERKGGQNNNNRPIDLPKVITFSTDYKYTT